MTDAFYGVISEQNKDTDFQLGGYLDFPTATNTFYTNKIQYQQTEVSPVSCTIHGPMGAVSDLTGYTFTLQERISMWADAVKAGANPSVGWWIDNAVDLVRKAWNVKNTNQLLSFRVSLDSPEFYAALDKGYSVVAGFSGNSTYQSDSSDGVLDGVAFPNTTFGHCLRITKADVDSYELIVDNYVKSSPSNTYKFDKLHLSKLLANSVFFKNGYIYVFKADYDSMQNIPAWALSAYTKAKNKGLKVDSIEDKLIVSEIEDYLVKVGVFTSKLGNISRGRLLVALERLNKL